MRRSVIALLGVILTDVQEMGCAGKNGWPKQVQGIGETRRGQRGFWRLRCCFGGQRENTQEVAGQEACPFGVRWLIGRRYGFYIADVFPLAPAVRGQIDALGALEAVPEAAFGDWFLYQVDVDSGTNGQTFLASNAHGPLSPRLTLNSTLSPSRRL